MPVLKSLNETFDTVAATYEKLRPGYSDDLYQAIFDYIPIDEHSRVVEVGSGSGQATSPILKTGCQLTAVEVGKHFSALLKDKFREYKGFSVITGNFECTEFEENVFDLVFSASAFHWVPEKIGYEKVFSMLKKGGAFARFANHPYRSGENSALVKQMDEIYAEYYYKYYNKAPEAVTEYTEEQAKNRAMIACKYGFTDIQYALFYRKRVFSAKEYVQLLGTYSDHIAIEEAVRTKFFSEVEKAIDSYGGTMTVYDTIDLQLARK